MKGIFTTTISILILVFSIAGCKKNNTKDLATCDDNKASWPFLEAGHKLVYLQTYPGGATDTVTYILGTESSGKFPVSVVTTSGSSTYYGSGSWWSCNFGWYISYTHVTNDNIHSFIASDAIVGDSWICDDTVTNNEMHVLVSRTATITTPITGHTYTGCYKFTVEQVGSGYADTIYVDQDLGEVFSNGPDNITFELISKNF